MSAAELRKSYAARRDSLSPEERSEKSVAIWKRLVELPEFQAASQALFYISFKSEVETELMRSLSRALGMLVAAPRSEPHSKEMLFHVLGEAESLESGAFGLLQPSAACPEAGLSRSSVALVPGLVFDAACNRLGWGEGYYDRFLSGPGRAVAKVGLAFECQISPALNPEAHDVPLDAVVTESRILRPSRS
jgi:5-formyltetrahydrofolate cyclo-ligase